MQPLIRSVLLRGVSPSPPRWEAAFGRRAPLEVDLGCGRGDYALERARGRPDLDLVALDARRSWVLELRRKAATAGLRNLRAICCDAGCDLPLLFGPSTVRGFTIFHPDPWWKKRHRKRRLVKPQFVALLARLLEPQGWVFVQTDVPDLAAEIEQIFLSSLDFLPIEPQQFFLRFGPLPPSRRQKRCERLGLPFRRLVFLKKS